MKNYSDIERPQSLTITLTEDAVARAQPENKGHCLIAEALRQRFPKELKSVNVADGHVRFNFEGYRYMYRMPAKAILLAQQFDETKGADKWKLVGEKFVLDNRDAMMQPVRVLGPRKPRTAKNTRKTGPRLDTCKRRYHATTAIRVPAK